MSTLGCWGYIGGRYDSDEQGSEHFLAAYIYKYISRT